MSDSITKTQIDWSATARIVSAKTGRRYAANYCGEVARGRRKSAKLESILTEMGVMMAPEISANTIDPQKPEANSPEGYAHNEQPRFCYRTYGDSTVVVYQVDPGLREVQVGDVIISANGVTGPRLMEISATDDQPLEMEIARAYPPGMIRVTRRKIQSKPILPESPSDSVIIGVLARACVLNAANPQRLESDRLLRQRRTLAHHLHATLSSLRSTRQELADALDRLAVTAEALGEEKAERILEHVARITLSENLKKEQETNTRLDAVVRRLSARPRIKRGTTHVEIGGIVFRNRTSKRRSLA